VRFDAALRLHQPQRLGGAEQHADQVHLDHRLDPGQDWSFMLFKGALQLLMNRYG